MFEKKLTILDSYPCLDRSEWRRRSVKKLEICLEEMLDDNSMYESSTAIKPLISDFVLDEPKRIGKQLADSNDCGVWVALWMSTCTWKTDYENVKVTDESRMRIAIDLVLHDYNLLKNLIVSKASGKWVELHKRWCQS